MSPFRFSGKQSVAQMTAEKRVWPHPLVNQHGSSSRHPKTESLSLSLSHSRSTWRTSFLGREKGGRTPPSLAGDVKTGWRRLFRGVPVSIFAGRHCAQTRRWLASFVFWGPVLVLHVDPGHID